MLKRIAITLRDNLEEKFDSENILYNSMIFDAKAIRRLSNKKIGSYGKDTFSNLLKYYDRILNTEHGQKEWRLAKISLRNMTTDSSLMTRYSQNY